MEDGVSSRHAKEQKFNQHFLSRSRRWEDNIRNTTDFREMGWQWINVAQDVNQWLAVMSTVTNIRVP
jgi:hypothetical protein